MITFVLFVNFCSVLYVHADEVEEWADYQEARARATVLEVRDIDVEESDYIVDIDEVIVEITHGEYKGQQYTIENAFTGNPAYDMYLEAGDKVVLLLEVTGDDITAAYIEDYYRMDMVYVLAALFAALVIIIGRWQGLRSLLTLFLTVILVWWVLIPFTLQGSNPVLVSVAVAVAAIISTFVIVGGLNTKSLTAILGTSGGIILGGILATIFSNWGHLTGMSMQEAQMLVYAPGEIAYNFRGLLLAGIIIGSLGAIMDIGMSIASSMAEIHKQAPQLAARELWQAGLNIGRDVMGTMVNTLILAYAGTSLPLLMLFRAYEMPAMRILNMDLVVSEVVRSLAGSIGLICCIPLTALIAAFIYTRSNEQ